MTLGTIQNLSRHDTNSVGFPMKLTPELYPVVSSEFWTSRSWTVNFRINWIKADQPHP